MVHVCARADEEEDDEEQGLEVEERSHIGRLTGLVSNAADAQFVISIKLSLRCASKRGIKSFSLLASKSTLGVKIRRARGSDVSFLALRPRVTQGPHYLEPQLGVLAMTGLGL